MQQNDAVCAAPVHFTLGPDIEQYWTELHFRVESTLTAQRPSQINQAWQGVAAAVRDLIDAKSRPVTSARAGWAKRRGAELADLLTALDKEITTSIDGAAAFPVDYAADERWVAAQECRRFFDRMIGSALLHAHVAHLDAQLAASRC